MAPSPDAPESIQQATLLVRRLLAKPVLTRQDKETLHNTRLQIVFWACRAENILPTRDNLAYILGPDAAEVMAVYDRKIKEQKKSRGTGFRPSPDSTSVFWDK